MSISMVCFNISTITITPFQPLAAPLIRAAAAYLRGPAVGAKRLLVVGTGWGGWLALNAAAEDARAGGAEAARLAAAAAAAAATAAKALERAAEKAAAAAANPGMEWGPKEAQEAAKRAARAVRKAEREMAAAAAAAAAPPPEPLNLAGAAIVTAGSLFEDDLRLAPYVKVRNVTGLRYCKRRCLCVTNSSMGMGTRITHASAHACSPSPSLHFILVVWATPSPHERLPPPPPASLYRCPKHPCNPPPSPTTWLRLHLVNFMHVTPLPPPSPPPPPPTPLRFRCWWWPPSATPWSCYSARWASARRRRL